MSQGVDPFANIESLYFIWNADWSLLGAARAAADFVRGVEACALCEIAYDGPRKKPEWTTCHASIPVPIETLFRNQVKEPLAGVADEYPVVLASVGGRIIKLMGKTEIEQCEGNVDRFKQALTEKATTIR